MSNPADPTADIGESVAAETALKIVAKRFKATKSTVIKSRLMSDRLEEST